MEFLSPDYRAKSGHILGSHVLPVKHGRIKDYVSVVDSATRLVSIIQDGQKFVQFACIKC